MSKKRIVKDWPGLSPRVRGNHQFHIYPISYPGSIPACAGEPGEAQATAGLERVYPRVCGGTANQGLNQQNDQGLSPRVRGNHQFHMLGRNPIVISRVYPRVCGGTW